MAVKLTQIYQKRAHRSCETDGPEPLVGAALLFDGGVVVLPVELWVVRIGNIQ